MLWCLADYVPFGRAPFSPSLRRFAVKTFGPLVSTEFVVIERLSFFRLSINNATTKKSERTMDPNLSDRSVHQVGAAYGSMTFDDVCC